MPKTLVKFLTRAVEVFIVADLAILTGLVFCNVALRYFTNSSIPATEELALYLLIWMVYMAAILAFSDGSHIRVDLVDSKLPPSIRRIVSLFCDLLMLGACIMLLIGCFIQGSIDMSNDEIITGIPRGMKFVSGGVFSAVIITLLLGRMYTTLVHGVPSYHAAPKGDAS